MKQTTMKSPIFMLLFLPLINAVDEKFIESFMDKLHEVVEKCSEEVHPSPDDITELVSQQIPKSHEGKCLIFCIQKSLEFQKPDGAINRQGAMNFIAPLKDVDPQGYMKILKVFVTCGLRVKVDPDPCITATNLLICGKQEGKAGGVGEFFFS